MTEQKRPTSKLRSHLRKNTTRRHFLTTTAKAGVGVAAAWPFVLTPGKAKAATVIRYADDGGRTGQGRDKLYIKPFMKKTGIEVRTRIGDHKLAKLKAMLKTGNLEVDVSQLNAPQSMAGMKEGLFEKLDRSKLDLSNHVFPQWQWRDTVAWEYYSGGLGYNTETFKADQVPQSWADFWNVKKFPGRRGIRPRPQETLEKALMADGVAAKDLYPLDMDRAFKSMDRIKEHINIWIPSAAKSVEHLQSKELDYTYTYSGRIMTARGEGVPLAFNFDIPLSVPQNMVILKGAKNYDACLQLIGWFLDPEPGATWFTQYIGYGPTDKRTADKLSAEVKSKLPSYDNQKAAWINPEWWGENMADATKRFAKWQLS
jgi:putative spermidine/putrescine transport system substrate-binding protein